MRDTATRIRNHRRRRVVLIAAVLPVGVVTVRAVVEASGPAAPEFAALPPIDIDLCPLLDGIQLDALLCPPAPPATTQPAPTSPTAPPPAATDPPPANEPPTVNEPSAEAPADQPAEPSAEAPEFPAPGAAPPLLADPAPGTASPVTTPAPSTVRSVHWSTIWSGRSSPRWSRCSPSSTCRNRRRSSTQ